MVNEWTRDDLPSVMDLVKASVDAMAIDPSGAADAALYAVVAHLNAHHPKPRPITRDDLPDEGTLAVMMRAIFDGYIVESGEVLLPGSALRRFLDAMVGYLNDHGGLGIDTREPLERTLRKRDEWRARAEAAEARTAVTREEVEKAITVGVRGTTDGDLIDQDASIPSGECVRLAVDATCDLFGIEAEQAVDPVEAKARELAKAGGIDFDEQDPEIVEMLLGIARHVLGKETDDE